MTETIKRGRGRPKGSKDNKPRITNKANCYNLKPGENTKMIHHARKMIELGRVNTESIEDLEDRLDWFLRYCEQNDLKPTIKMFAGCCGIDVSTFSRWAREQTRTEAHRDFVLKVRAFFGILFEEMLMNDVMHPTIAKLQATNNYGYRDKQEFSIEPVEPIIKIIDYDKIIENNLEYIEDDSFAIENRE